MPIVDNFFINISENPCAVREKAAALHRSTTAPRKNFINNLKNPNRILPAGCQQPPQASRSSSGWFQQAPQASHSVSGWFAEAPQVSCSLSADLRRLRKCPAACRLVCGSSASVPQLVGRLTEAPQARRRSVLLFFTYYK
jgi:hypothetical protein